MATESLTWTPTTARWIWLPGEERPSNGYAQFRRSFGLESPPASAAVHVTADCRYLLFLNGQVVGRGPIVTPPRFKQVDVYEVAPWLRPGKNEIKALVLQRHHPTSRVYAQRGGFLLELTLPQLPVTDNNDASRDVSLLSVGTDASWQARWATEYKFDAPLMTHQYGHQEWLDARKKTDDWVPALPVDQPEQIWQPALELRTVPHMGRKVIHPVRLLSYFGLTSYGKPMESDPEPARHIQTAYPMSSTVVWNADAFGDPARGPVTFLEQQGDGVGFVVDLGKEYYGYPFIDFEVECAGATVNLGHGEVLSRNRIQTVLMMDQPPEQRYADRYFTRAGRQRWELFDTKGCRYLEIHFHRLANFYTGAKVMIHEVGLVHSEPPFERKSEFECSDARLNQVWEICSHTAQIMAQDSFICDAQREQNNWPDFIQQMLYLQAFGRAPAGQQLAQNLCRIQMPSGFFLNAFPPVCPKRVEDITEAEQYLFCTMALPTFIYNDWLFAGPDHRQSFWLECCAKSCEFLARHLGPHGTLANLPGDHWCEWSGLEIALPGRNAKTSWEMTFWNAWHVLALEQMAEMTGAAVWRERAASLRAAAHKRFWSKERQAYLDGIYDGRPTRTISQSTQAIAVLARLGDDRQLRAAMKTAEDPTRCDVPSAINLMSFYHEALQSIGMDKTVPGRLRRKYGKMIDLSATTTWEGEEALERNMGLCLPFAGHPLNYLTRTALGITPLGPGYREFSVQIVPHGLKRARGRIATPRGYIEIEWHKKGGRFELALTVPDGTEAHVAPPRTGGRAKATMVATCDGQAVQLQPLTVALCTFLRSEQPALKVGVGKHSISFQ